MTAALAEYPEYTGVVAPDCRNPSQDPARVYAMLVRREVDAAFRPAKPCKPCRWMVGRMRAEPPPPRPQPVPEPPPPEPGADLALALRSADCHVVGRW